MSAPPSMLARALGDAASISRFHILVIGAVASITFGWLMTGHYVWAAAGLSALDWFLINLANKVTDIEEDLKNQIQGTERVARNKRVLETGVLILWFGSLGLVHLWEPRLTPWRLAVALIGLAYSYRWIPTPSGMKRMKELYFFKNFGSSVLFVLTGFVYPLAIAGDHRVLPWATIVFLAAFFVPFELTYEILYDFRDLEGDRAVGIPTYPVVHGPERARQIIDALLVLSALVLVAGFVSGWLGLLEMLMLVAPAAQLAFYRPRLARGLTSRDCIVLTHLGTAQLVFFLIGTAVWRAAGLPANVYL
ncbi:MAG: UbiA family prenyltransferase [Kofleriaceae bacterium]|nr:UbiA family prenyltransferase [Kofleriaceae bacterium]